MEFDKNYKKNVEVIRDKDVVKLIISENIGFENGEDYKIEVQWYGGGIRVWTRFYHGKFIPITKESML